MAHWQILRMFELFLVGIGTGNPEHITIQARRAIGKLTLFLFLTRVVKNLNW